MTEVPESSCPTQTRLVPTASVRPPQVGGNCVTKRSNPRTMNRCGRDLLPDCEDASSSETYREQGDSGLDFSRSRKQSISTTDALTQSGVVPNYPPTVVIITIHEAFYPLNDIVVTHETGWSCNRHLIVAFPETAKLAPMGFLVAEDINGEVFGDRVVRLSGSFHERPIRIDCVFFVFDHPVDD